MDPKISDCKQKGPLDNSEQTLHANNLTVPRLAGQDILCGLSRCLEISDTNVEILSKSENTKLLELRHCSLRIITSGNTELDHSHSELSGPSPAPRV